MPEIYQNLLKEKYRSDIENDHPSPDQSHEGGYKHTYIAVSTLPVSAEIVWPYVSNTSEINRILSVGRMILTEKGNDIIGRYETSLFNQEWIELPWEWEAGKEFSLTRIYTKGLAYYFQQVVRLVPNEDGKQSTTLISYFRWHTKNLFFKWIVDFYMRKFQHKYHQLIDDMVTNNQTTVRQVTTKTYNQKQLNNNLKPYVSKLIDLGFQESLVLPFLHHLQTADSESVDRIQVKKLSIELSLPFSPLLEMCLQATKIGLLNLTWDIICPHCKRVRTESVHLVELQKHGTCGPCGIDFDATGVNGQEVTFHIHPSIRTIEPIIYCSAQPARRPDIYLQEKIPPGRIIHKVLSLPAGRYRLRVHKEKIYNLLDIGSEYTNTEIVWEQMTKEAHFQSSPNVSFILQNTANVAHSFIIERYESDAHVLRPNDLFQLQTFRNLFPEQAIAEGLKLDIGVQNIMFTDICGSTKMYEQIGDAKAFSLVRRHFLKDYEIIQRYDGVIIKSLGDAIMAAFPTPFNALKASIELQEYFTKSNPDTHIRLRISLHSGSCYAVNLDTNIDYFGQTVNLAAKLQSLVEAGQIVFSKSFMNQTEFQPLTESQKYQLESLTFKHEALKQELEVYRLTLNND